MADLLFSTPKTIQNNVNLMKNAVNDSGSSHDTTCLQNLLGNNSTLTKFINLEGTYNSISASNPIWHPPYSFDYIDYNQYCPDGWTQSGNNCYAPPNYTGPCNSGLTVKKCPPNNSTSWYQSCNRQCSGWWIFRTCRNVCNWYPNNPAYTGWYDQGKDSKGNLTCTAGWRTNDSQSQAQYDCQRYGGEWVPLDYRYNPYTCRNPKQQIPPSGFQGYTAKNKQDWAYGCGADWPKRTQNVPGKWQCTYGTSLQDDVSGGRLSIIGNVQNNNLQQAATMLFQKQMGNTQLQCFGISNNVVYIPSGGNDCNIFKSKGVYLNNCSERNNAPVYLYSISPTFWQLLERCKGVNTNINSVNDALPRLRTKAFQF